MFSTHYPDILAQIGSVDPVAYGKTRNFIDGAVTRLSPYLSRGVISTRQVYHSVLKRGFEPSTIEKFIQELAWRDYWQQIWVEKKSQINQDIKRPQPQVENHEMPCAILEASTGIQAIDEAIDAFYSTGYLHNHLRMYIAMMACNLGGSHWMVPARWMYHHLLDGDWASNALSWQWVAGSNAGKKYFANQDNINKYCYSSQKGTFLDCSYDAFEHWQTPQPLTQVCTPTLKTQLPPNEKITFDPSLPTLLYNGYNLDPMWRTDLKANRILLLEPSVFEAYPISQNSLEFILSLSRNIQGVQVWTGEFSTFKETYCPGDIYYKEHPLYHYSGIEDPRDWMFSVKGYYPSFFAFWKKCKKEIKSWNQSTLFG